MTTEALRKARQFEDYTNGLKCAWDGRSVTNMDKNELVAFIGMLDALATIYAEKLVEHGLLPSQANITRH